MKKKKKRHTRKWSWAGPEAFTTRPPLSIDQQPDCAKTVPAFLMPVDVLNAAVIGEFPSLIRSQAAIDERNMLIRTMFSRIIWDKYELIGNGIRINHPHRTNLLE